MLIGPADELLRADCQLAIQWL